MGGLLRYKLGFIVPLAAEGGFGSLCEGAGKNRHFGADF